MDSMRKQIVDNRVEALSMVVKDAYLLGNRRADGSYPALNILPSGTYAGMAPVKYTVSVTGAAQVTYQDVTNSGAPVVASVTSGVPLAIGATGISLTATFTGTLTVGDSFILRMNKSSQTLLMVAPWQMSRDKYPLPFLFAFDFSETKEKTMIDRYTCKLQFVLEVWLGDSDHLSDEIRNLVGDIENEWNRDNRCGELCVDSYIIESKIFTSDGADKLVGAHILAECHYRHQITDVSIKK